MDEAIRVLLKQNTKLRVSVDQLPANACLFDVGLDSLAMVNVMLALEDSFGIEIPDAMLSRETFASVAALRNTVMSLQRIAA